MTESVITYHAGMLDKMDLPLCSIANELLMASQKLKVPHMLFLTPILDYCLVDGCNGMLYWVEKVIYIKLFTMNDPQPRVNCLQ